MPGRACTRAIPVSEALPTDQAKSPPPTAEKTKVMCRYVVKLSSTPPGPPFRSGPSRDTAVNGEDDSCPETATGTREPGPVAYLKGPPDHPLLADGEGPRFTSRPVGQRVIPVARTSKRLHTGGSIPQIPQTFPYSLSSEWL